MRKFLFALILILIVPCSANAVLIHDLRLLSDDQTIDLTGRIEFATETGDNTNGIVNFVLSGTAFGFDVSWGREQINTIDWTVDPNNWFLKANIKLDALEPNLAITISPASFSTESAIGQVTMFECISIPNAGLPCSARIVDARFIASPFHVPEPSVMLLLGAAILSFAMWHRLIQTKRTILAG